MLKKTFNALVVNLKKEKQKKINMQLILNEAAIKFNFFNAIDGSTLSDEEIKKINTNRKKLKGSPFNRDLTQGEIGCLLSHYEIYKKINENDIYLILEDDINIDDKLQDFLQRTSFLPKNWDVILVGHHVLRSRPARIALRNRYRLSNYTLGKPVELAFGTYGYLINYQGAQKLIKALNNINAPIDHYTGNRFIVNTYALLEPLILFQDDLSASDIEIHRNIEYVSSGKGLTESIKKLSVNSPLFPILKKTRDCFWNAKARLAALISSGKYL